jgi:vacuolar-type H+-ATPase subunit E/Vma4
VSAVPLEGLVGALARDTEREAEVILARAREEAQAIARESAERLARLLEARAAPALAGIRAESGARRAAARREARTSVLAARDRCIDRVLAAARAQLRALGDSEREAVTVAAVGAALEFAPPSQVTIHCPARDVSLVRTLTRERQGVTVTADDRLTLGVRLIASEPPVVVDATIEGALDRSRDALAIEIVGALEGS